LVGLLLFPALGLVDFQARVNACERRDFLANIRALVEQGNALAQNSLGGKYATGQGVSQDYQEAVMWYRRAAEQGNASAQYNLGVMYDNGQGVSQDYVLAHMWANLAASQGGEARVKKRDAIATFMTPAQLAEAQRLAREWKAKGK